MEYFYQLISNLIHLQLELTPEEFERIEKRPVNKEDQYYYKKIG